MNHGDPNAKLSKVVDPAAPPLTEDKMRRYELRVTELPLEVAPGGWQTRWTFNGESVAPTLRGKVGDQFEITLINDGTMGHSLDFHAGNIAPDEAMRTIAPGETLVYRFEALRAGMWMYHCSTMPMSLYIAAGMHGAVIIEPKEGLPPVDKEYVIVQSEIYGDLAARQEDATTVDEEALSEGKLSKVVFNGIANQYDQEPFTAKVGEKSEFSPSTLAQIEPQVSISLAANSIPSTARAGTYLRIGKTHSDTPVEALKPLPCNQLRQDLWN